MMFYPVDDLRDKEIFLRLNHTRGAQPEKCWLPAYGFEICLQDGTKIGKCSLRIGHNEKSYIGGNIGYGIDEAYRGHHYAAKACVLLFRQAAKHGMDHVIITCDPANRASARTCELAGGQYLETAAIPEDHEMYAEGKRQVMIWRVDLSFRIDAERVSIRKFTADMARDVHENSLDEDNRRFVPDEVFETEEEARETVEFLIAQYGKPDAPQVYPVFTRKDGRNIGYVQLVPIGEGRWEIGYHIAAKYTGRGYATEAVRAFLPVIVRKTGIREVTGICLKANAASARVMEKCGFQTVYVGIGDYQGEKREIVRCVWRTDDREKETE